MQLIIYLTLLNSHVYLCLGGKLIHSKKEKRYSSTVWAGPQNRSRLLSIQIILKGHMYQDNQEV